ncbi:hypothetical protein [Neobacillus vireti]|uniref:DUF5105 domain-containing protein n=1 Tax=Neobacillus vireti LMG 21834 TaxID=1131730 RepID=A0AB94IT42_9BACI|nr:hypothetical protein [Neobacillus vireti]ETI70138.1 hypothetical protein BAVI_03594 [Neobacillus vireti LMG 21834]KLT16486.1 hypothetical protein AA980_18645 [Neobacillus vireti]
MKKKSIISLFSVMVLVIAMLGTVAYFSKSFTSDKNIATAAKFNVIAVDSKGNAIGDGQFNLGDELTPGMDALEAYSFKIDKNGTKVPVEYKVNFTMTGDLFPGDNSSPVELTLQSKDGDNWVDVDYSKPITPQNEVENFRVMAAWPHGDNDADFAGKTGNIKLEVIATQVDGNTVKEAKKMYDEANNALNALDAVGSGFNVGNFSKAQSNAVQAQIDALIAYVNGLPSSKGKTDLLADVASLQSALTKKVESRYVSYEIDTKYTNLTQLGLKLSADHSGQVIRNEEARAMMVSAQYQDYGKMFSMEYHPATKKDAAIGDQFKYGLRFNGGVKTIDVTFTNLGAGKWKIDSDWLVEKK